MDDDIPERAPDRESAKAAEAGSDLLRLLRLLAREVARRLPAAKGPGGVRPPDDA